MPQTPQSIQKITPKTAYTELLKKLPAAIQGALNVEGARRTLRVNRVWVDTAKHDRMDLDDYQEAKSRGGSLTAPIFADISLMDNATGLEVMARGKPARAKTMRIGELPVLTPHGGYLLNGVDYVVHHQLRLDPSIYTVVKDNGDLVSTFNLAKGSKGKRLGLHYDSEAGSLNMSVGTSKVPLVPVLHAMGVDDRKISEAIGGEFLAQNLASAGDEGKATRHVAGLLTGENFQDPQKATMAIREFMAGTVMDPEAVARTHGHERGMGTQHSQIFGTLSPEVLLAQAKKHMEVYRGDRDPDARDSMVNKTIHGTDDHIPGRFEHWKNKNLLKFKIKPRLDAVGNDSVKNIVSASDVSRLINKYFLSSGEDGAGLLQVSEQNNPLQIVSDAHKITLMGEGGISGAHSVPNSTRLLHPSQFGIMDPLISPESAAIGTIFRASHGSLRIGNKMGAELLDLRADGAKTPVPLDTYYEKVTAFPDQFKMDGQGRLLPKGSKVRAIQNGKVAMFNPDEVDYMFPSAMSMFSSTTRTIPLTGAISGNRATMGAKQVEQALPLVDPDVHFVRPMVDGASPMEDPATGFARLSDVDGTVESVDSKRIHIRSADGQLVKHGLYDHFPSQSGALLHHTPLIKPGDAVKKGQVIADSSFTKGGHLAMGRNLLTALLPSRGSSYEDGVCISETAAKRLVSRHVEVKEFPLEDENSFTSLEKFRVSYPGHVTNEQAARMDNDGIIKVGQTIAMGEPVILGLKRRQPTPEEAVLSKVSRKIYKPLVNSAVNWDGEDIGKVVRVNRLKDKVRVYVQYDSQMKVGDKLSDFGGGLKGIVTKIIPDAHMPIQRDGKRVEVLLNPLGPIGRAVSSANIEMLAGKISEHDGKPFYADSFTDEDYDTRVLGGLKERGLSDTEDLIDPQTQRVIPDVTVGPKHFLKLKHTVASKFSARDTAGYDIDGQPLRGGAEGAKRMDPLQLYALLAHGANDLAQDVVRKSNKDDEMWRNIKTGQPLPPLRPTFATEKLLSLLNAAGINTVKNGTRITLTPLTDKAVLAQSGGQITNAGSLHGEDYREVPGGLFDKDMVGGMSGSRWGHVTLSEPFPNPTMGSAIMSLAGITEAQLDGLVAGKLGVGADGKVAEFQSGMSTGGHAIGQMLDKVDPQTEFDSIRARLQTEGSRATIDKLNKRGKYLRGLINAGMSPREAYLINHVPILPPKYRPVVPAGNGQLAFGGLNGLYRDLILVNEKLAAMKDLGPEHASELRETTYDALKAVQGLGDSVSGRDYRGVFKIVSGVGSPKCYDAETEVLTRSGWIRFDEYDGRSAVGTVNLVTDRFEWQAPEDVIHQRYSGPMLHTKLRDLDLLVTPNHNHVAQVRTTAGRRGVFKFSDWRMVRADEIAATTNRRRLMTAAAWWDGVTPTYEFDGIRVDADALASVCGWWVAEGWIGGHSRPPGGKKYFYPYVAICQLAGSRFVPDIDACVEKLGLPFSRREYDRPFTNVVGTHFPGRKVIFWELRKSNEFTKWVIDNFGRGAENKFISPEVLDWNGRHLRLFLDGYLMGDATVRDRRPSPRKTQYRATGSTARFSTVSKRLADCIQALCVKIGRRANPRWKAPQSENHRPSYRGSILGHRDTMVEYPRHTTKIDFDGVVYSVTVPNGTVVVRRNGIVAVSGNSGMIQRKLLGRPMDAVGRSTIIPDPDLHMDEIGMPEDMAWREYQPWIVKELAAIGVPPLSAADEIDRRTSRASEALDKAMAKRPVTVNRAPSLHKFSVMAFNAKRVPGSALHIPPLVFKGFNADTDGDSMTGDVIVRIGNAAPTVMDIEEVVKLSTKRSTKKRAISYEPPKGLLALSIAGGVAPTWLPVDEVSEHPDLIMYDVTPAGSPGPLSLSRNASLMAIDRETGFHRSYEPGESLGKYVPTAREVDVSQFDYAAGRPGDFEKGYKAGRSGFMIIRFVFGNTRTRNGKANSAHKFVGNICSRSREYRLGFVSGILSQSRGRGGAGRVPSFRSSHHAVATRFIASTVGIYLRFSGSDQGRFTMTSMSIRPSAAKIILSKIKSGVVSDSWYVFSDWADELLDLAGKSERRRGFSEIKLVMRRKTLKFWAYSFNGWIHIDRSDLLSMQTVPMPIETMDKFSAIVDGEEVCGLDLFGMISGSRAAEFASGEDELIRSNGKYVPYSDSGALIAKNVISLRAAINFVTTAPSSKIDVTGLDLYKILRAYVYSDVALEPVMTVSLQDRRKTGYDFSVPDSHVFCSASGASLKNTMITSVPISDAAVKDARTKMMPSSNLINPGTHGLMMLPNQEAAWGLWSLTAAGKKTGASYPDMDSAMKDYLDGKILATDVITAGGIETTPGRIEVNSSIPEKYRDYAARWDAGKTRDVLQSIAKDDPKSYDDVIFNIKAAGDDAAYFMGMTTRLRDLSPVRKVRDTVLQEADRQYQSSAPSKENLLRIYGKANALIDDRMGKHYESNPNGAWDMLQSGALGKKAQLMQMMSGPLIVNDENNEPVMYPVSKSYTEGLNISDYIATLYGQRRGIIDRAISTAEPGEIQKETLVAAVKQQISQADCGADGVQLPLDDKSIYHRLLGADLKIDGRLAAKRGDVVTHRVVDAARAAKLGEINVRSALNCQSHHGICQHDAGLSDRGEKFPLGFNLGALSASTISEPLTQGTMKNFHQGNTAFSKTISGLDRIRQLIELPKMAAGQGPLSSVAGTVEDVRKMPSGDYRVTVAERSHFVPAGMMVQVKKGDVVEQGAPLSAGVQNPHEILQTRGLHEARKYLVDEMHRSYKEGNNLDLDRRHFEVIAKTLSDHAYVDDPGDAPALLRGDHMSITKVEAYNKMLVANGKRPIEFSPQLRGAVQSAISTDDWMARTSSRLLTKKLQEAAGFGLTTEVGAGGHPLARYIYGTHMGDSVNPDHADPNIPASVQNLRLRDLDFHGPVSVAVHEKPLPVEKAKIVSPALLPGAKGGAPRSNS